MVTTRPPKPLKIKRILHEDLCTFIIESGCILLSIRQGDSLARGPEFGETHSSVLGCEIRPFSASIISRSCFAPFPVCVYKFSSHYLNNITFYIQ
jgi:hypothetical protein